VPPEPWTRESGAQPIPGYRLLEPLGVGGFGEVWKCEAPGGLFKAVKFVGQGEAGAQELAALQRVKTIRHPFILSLDRVEVVGGVLIIVMELADRSLHALHAECQARGEAGFPRDELLAYLHEAAEALDWMNFEHGLAHLDIKPHNLFVVSNHVKVADFGLVHSLGEAGAGRPARRQGGLTPLYASPELLRGDVSRHSDQYSLAIVYQQLLTGTVPFWHESVYELGALHLCAEPDLSALPAGDRPAIARALAKLPEDRFPSCTEMLQALAGVPTSSGGSRRSSGSWRRVLLPPRDEAGPQAPPPGLAHAKTARPGPARDQPTRLVSPAAPAAPGAARRTALPSPTLAPLAGGGQPNSVSLPGYRFLQCLAQTPLGDLWRAEDAEGRERRALCLLSFVHYDAQLIARLQALRHPALPPTEVCWSAAERLVLVTDGHKQTLRDRFEACRAAGRPGVPRDELLRHLRAAAEALDALHEWHGLCHLGLHPSNLLVQDDRLWVADFGLVQLVWLPTGQLAGPLNARYAAPELFEPSEGGPGPGADQYSLALIYAEMLSGAPPRPQRPDSAVPHPAPGRGRRARPASTSTCCRRPTAPSSPGPWTPAPRSASRPAPP
jgi:serine/threonine protein kinase